MPGSRIALMTDVAGALSPPVLPRGADSVARTWVVSWLRAVTLAFPTARGASSTPGQWLMSARSTSCLPVTVAGPHRH